MPFTAQRRMSGVNLPDGRRIRKGSPDAIIKHVKENHGSIPEIWKILLIALQQKALRLSWLLIEINIVGVIALEDILKPLIHERFASLRRMGLRTIMITGDNPQNSCCYRSRAGVDDYLAEATPEIKLAYIRKEQS